MADLRQLNGPQGNVELTDENDDSSSVNSGFNQDDSTATDNHTTTGTSDEGKDSNSEAKMSLAKKETAAVFRLRALVFCVLLLGAVSVSVIVYFVTATSERDEYVTQYEGASQKVLDTFLDIVRIKMEALSSLEVAISLHGIDHSSDWPFVSISSFHRRASTVRKQSGALMLQINPIVNDTTRELWEEYVSQHKDSEWISDGLEYQEENGLYDFEDGITDGWGGYEARAEPWPIWSKKDGKVATIDKGPGPYLPTWQSSPVIYNGELVNENLLNTPVSALAANESVSTGSVVIGDFQFSEPGYYDSEDPTTSKFALLLSLQQQTKFQYRGDPIGNVYFPIFDSFKADRKPVALVTALLHWKSYFRDILPHNIKGVIYVLRNTCGGSFTYELVADDVRPLGYGDLHDPQFEDKRRSADFSSLENISDGTKLGLPLSLARCSVGIDVYPSLTFYDQYNTGTPIIMTCAVGIIFVFTALMFLFYDRLVEKRQKLVMEKAIQTNAIVASLFPENVRERLMKQAAEAAEERMAKQKGGDFLAPNHRLKGYLDGKEQDDIDQAPIADLFPHCTVMFADIAGFTAWSSTRDPAQVFILLQTVYQAFDKIAKRRKVFKVETIGDSYVAVTGLPDPQPTHAVIMARFAGECKEKLNELVSQLESSLGPDTGDLTMRLGLHSGPVTAGVLRGDRARFQLFGDTVNTAARMESTGVKDRIHCSQTTYTLLMEAGKENWVKPRADAVQAKGKGTLKTFWINPTSKKSSSTGASSISGTDVTENNSASTSQNPLINSGINPAVLAIRKESASECSKAKQQRLVDWIVDMLHEHLRKVVALRKYKSAATALTYKPKKDQTSLDEVAEVIILPRFDQTAFSKADDYRKVQIDPKVMSQLREFVDTIASWYRANPFHNFEHACHVTMATNKFLKRIVAPDVAVNADQSSELAATLHNYTHGINSDPLALLAIVVSALIHDVDHRGVSNTQLVSEDKEMGEKYRNKSVAEQNSLDISWDLLMEDKFLELRKCLFTDEVELKRFRQVLVNVVLATDIFDPELNGLRKNRWKKAFSDESLSDEENNDLRATIVIEHIIQASDVAHTMQHWHIYRKWNKRLFKELYLAYCEGRMGKDPSEFWYNGEIGFFDNYVIPLAKKLKECNVFGVSSDECLNYALQNRDEWKQKGKDIVEELKREVDVKQEIS